MRHAVLLVLVAGCAEPHPEYVYVDQTVEYAREPGGPGSYADCLAQSPDTPNMCEYRLRLCDNGVVDIMLGDQPFWGTYRLVEGGEVALGVTQQGEFELDLVTLRSMEWPGDWAPASSMHELLGCSLEYR